jgi:hypothetical protein
VVDTGDCLSESRGRAKGEEEEVHGVGSSVPNEGGGEYQPREDVRS